MFLRRASSRMPTYGSKQAHDTISVRFLEPEPGGDQVVDGVVMRVFVDALEEVQIYGLSIHALKRDY